MEEKGLELGKDINPSAVEYGEVQQGTAAKTVDREEKNVQREDEKQRKRAYEESKPTLKEGIKAAGISAAVEGGVTFCMSVAQKRKEKKFSEFTSDDWKEIFLPFCIQKLTDWRVGLCHNCTHFLHQDCFICFIVRLWIRRFLSE